MSKDVRQMEDRLGLLRLGYAQPLLELPARRWDDGAVSERVETIAEETPVALVYNGIPHAVMMATPQDLEDFALGFSLTEELIASPADLQRVECVRYSQGIEVQILVAPEREAEIAARTRRLTGRTGCGICGADSVASVLKTLHPVAAATTIRESAVRAAMSALTAHQTLNAAAGAVHAAGWANLEGSVELVREDVGRHNALDKLIGALLRRGTDPASGFVLVTSRASFEMVQKTTRFGAALMAAVSGPTGLAVRIAQQAGLTLVGFARGSRLTVYTHPERLVAG
ncbi:MAG TPA: formate dehydrogenase accessory sulfurtransferase FdhD [Gemmatimonadales bacterium]|jgi:formate dehydrogenase accessory protein FdhD|nr:formate dehydrogenase accessory sulfurtransferase FdhD [Gemmatimonadales bacterium]